MAIAAPLRRIPEDTEEQLVKNFYPKAEELQRLT